MKVKVFYKMMLPKFKYFRKYVCFGIKDKETNNEVWNARLVFHGYRNKLKAFLAQNTAISIQHSSKLLIKIAAIFEFIIFLVMLPKPLCKVVRNQ